MFNPEYARKSIIRLGFSSLRDLTPLEKEAHIVKMTKPPNLNLQTCYISCQYPIVSKKQFLAEAQSRKGKFILKKLRVLASLRDKTLI